MEDAAVLYPIFLLLSYRSIQPRAAGRIYDVAFRFLAVIWPFEAVMHSCSGR